MLHVLLFYERMIPSVRLCGHCQLALLQEQGRLAFRSVSEGRLTPNDLAWANVALFVRSDSSFAVRIAKTLHAAGRTVFYVMDDDLLNVPDGIKYAPYYRKPDVRKNRETLLATADGFVSPSPVLLAKYGVPGKRNFLIEEPAIDPAPDRETVPGAPVKIGFAGSVDRCADMENILGEALQRIKRRYGERVRLEFFGIAPSFAGEVDAVCRPYTDSYAAYREQLDALGWDLGLAPMPDTSFHSCKHYNKFVEYAAAGIPGVYSDLPPYTRVRERWPDCGVFCENTPEAWEAAIASLIDRPEQRERLRRAVLKTAKTDLSVAASAEALYRALSETAGDAALAAFGIGFALRLAVWKLQGYGERVMRFARNNGWSAPVTAAKKIFHMWKRRKP